MSIITIQCRLVASEETRRHFWELMAQKNTPLVNELLEQLGEHSDFQTWLDKGKLPAKTIENIVDSLKSNPQLAGQPGRFYQSAISLVDYTYKSWFALQKRRQRKIEGKERWLEILKSDIELEQASNSSLESIRAKAAEILNKISSRLTESPNQKRQTKKAKKTKKEDRSKASSSQFNILLTAYDRTEDTLDRCAIAYLLKNNCQRARSRGRFRKVCSSAA